MGVLADVPTPERSDGKFVRLYKTLDADDQRKIREWDEDPLVSISAIYRELSRHFDIGRSSVERGLADLREGGWET